MTYPLVVPTLVGLAASVVTLAVTLGVRRILHRRRRRRALAELSTAQAALHRRR